MGDHYYEGQVQYIGPRFVPRFATPIEWTKDKQYEQLEMVVYLGNTYTSRKPVPAGIEITNDEYWALTGNYNYQVEAYRQEVERYKGDIIDQFNITIADLDEKTKYNIKNPEPINIVYKFIYVNNATGNDESADGTKANPFKTLDAAVSFGNNYKTPYYQLINGTYELSSNVVIKSEFVSFSTDNTISTIIINNSEILSTKVQLYSTEKGNLTIDTEKKYLYFFNNFVYCTNVIFNCEINTANCCFNALNCKFIGIVFLYNTKGTCSNCIFEQPNNLNTAMPHGTVFPAVYVGSGCDITIMNDNNQQDNIGEPSNIFCDEDKAVFWVSRGVLRLFLGDDIYTKDLTTKYDYFVYVSVGELVSYMTDTGYNKVATTGITSQGNQKMTIFPQTE